VIWQEFVDCPRKRYSPLAGFAPGRSAPHIRAAHASQGRRPAADDPKRIERQWLFVIRLVGHALVKFALESGAFEALLLDQFAAPLHHLTMAAAVAGERRSGIDRKEPEPEQTNNAEVDRFANDPLLNHV
jgi:hypothetical protein